MSWMAMALGLDPEGRLLVGLEDEPDGSLRVYVNSRQSGLHTHVSDESAKAEVRRQYGSSNHCFASIPADALCDCPPPTARPVSEVPDDQPAHVPAPHPDGRP